MIRSTIMAVGLACAALPAAAEGWSISDLGEMYDRESCMDRARKVVNRYIFNNGGGETASDTWTIYAYDLTPGDQDIVIMCPWVRGDVVNAFLVVHGETDSSERQYVHGEIADYWEY